MEVVEELEKEKRKENLVVFGIPEEDDEQEGDKLVNDVINGLLPEIRVEFTALGRIHKKGLNPRPLRIKIDDAGHRRKILARAKDLHSSDKFNKIYINPDLTREQQLADMKLRKEVKRLREAGEIVKIIKGEIVKDTKPLNSKTDNSKVEISGVSSAASSIASSAATSN